MPLCPNPEPEPPAPHAALCLISAMIFASTKSDARKLEKLLDGMERVLALQAEMSVVTRIRSPKYDAQFAKSVSEAREWLVRCRPIFKGLAK